MLYELCGLLFFYETLFQIPTHMKSQEYMHDLKYLKFDLTDLDGKLQYVVYKMTMANEIMQPSKL